MNDRTEVLYNAECPVCSREVAHYARLSRKDALPITYDDLTDAERRADWGISADQAVRRLHVRKAGRTYVGLDAFIVLWREIRQMRWLARLFSLPLVHWAGSRIYDNVLAPTLYRLHCRRQRNKSILR